MSFSPIDKIPRFPPTVAPVEGEAGTRDLSPTSAPIDPHSVLALEVWSAAGPRVFNGSNNGPSAYSDPDEIAAHVVSFLI